MSDATLDAGLLFPAEPNYCVDLLTTADSDAAEARAARDRPIPHPAGGQHEHRLDCTCRRCLVEWHYSPGDGAA